MYRTLSFSGIPNPQKQHASIMARFAAECLIQMEHLVENLSKTLGRDTMELDLRVGLHSGPTTAGVLRGDRTRFQLFGDTVNTAARMESNGIPGKIHLSQQTADKLIEDGKGNWLLPREGLIDAKGKGKMKTYWMIVK